MTKPVPQSASSYRTCTVFNAIKLTVAFSAIVVLLTKWAYTRPPFVPFSPIFKYRPLSCLRFTGKSQDTLDKGPVYFSSIEVHYLNRMLHIIATWLHHCARIRDTPRRLANCWQSAHCPLFHILPAAAAMRVMLQHLMQYALVLQTVATWC